MNKTKKSYKRKNNSQNLNALSVILKRILYYCLEGMSICVNNVIHFKTMQLFNTNWENLHFMESVTLLSMEYFWEIKMLQWRSKLFKKMEYLQFVFVEAI